MAKNIIAGCNIRRNGHCPFVAIGNKLVGSVSADRPWSCTVIRQSGFIDLIELQRCLVHFRTRALAVCQIVDNRSMMTLRPRRPLKFDSASSFNFHRFGDGFCIPVTDDVRSSVLIGQDETKISHILDIPTNRGFSGLLPVSGVKTRITKIQ